MAAVAQGLLCIRAPTSSGLGFSACCSSVKGLGSSTAAFRPCSSSSTHHALGIRAMAPKKKVNAYDAGWSKQWFGAGIFAENTETEPINIVKSLEKKKFLSKVERAGLLSKAESAGLSLSTIEKLGLLSKAEDLGLLSLAEKFATASPPVLASLTLPLIVAAIAIPVFVPDSSSTLVLAQNIVSLLCLAGAGALFVGSVILSGLQDET